jgi:putative transposase
MTPFPLSHEFLPLRCCSLFLASLRSRQAPVNTIKFDAFTRLSSNHQDSVFQLTAAGISSSEGDAEECRTLFTHYTIFDKCVNICYACAMKQIITAKLKLHTDPAQFAALRKTQLAYRDALNHVSQYAFEHGKMSSGRALQRECYDDIRLQFGLPAQMACNVPRQVGATYKTSWTKGKQNAAARKEGLTKKRYKGLDTPPKYVSPTLTYNYHRDYSLKPANQVSLLTLDGRIIVPYTGYSKHVALLHHGASLGAAKLWYDKPRKQFYLLVSLETEVAEPIPEMHSSVVGVDVGQRYLAVTATPTNHVAFYSGKAVRAKTDHYARLRKRLQKKGTRSATRRLLVISGRERRLKQDRNHVISRRIVDGHPHSIIGLEDLNHIRDRCIRKHGKHASKKQRRANRHASQWAFAELHGYIAYKATMTGSMAVKVDANYTSKACPMCGYTSDANRPNKGLLFECQSCHYTLHADLIGARNIALRTLLVRQDWTSTGVLSVRPDVSSDEAKAERLRRYSELRWSLDTSPSPKGGRWSLT